ncbi:hypothetical protein OsJ_21698 [Oryza sativa Japonica Group]|uniref:TTF-type domain-containing protein n=1 Tax=Oryza sativa subsp. japonica TaxID=39947 RepID=B9FTS4_ORYSJ|nr:hypothetical protein OsJ_21698 [Oryza sativa Japonica Group]
MKKRKGPAVDLKSFLEKSAAKKANRSQTPGEGNLNPIDSNLNPSCNESQMQLVIYQGHHHENESGSPASSSTIPIDPAISDMPGSNDESQSSDEDNDGGLYDIEHDPGLRTPISRYDVNDQDSVRRAYIALGPCRPKMKKDDFPQHSCGGMRRFLPKWFDEFKWLEYSVNRDAAYCFVCYLFKESNHGGDAFVNGGFRNWNMKGRFHKHCGAVNSAHCEAEEKYILFMKPKSSIHESFASNSAQVKADDVTKDEKFTNLKGLAELSMMLVKTERVRRYELVYRLLKLVLVLPVATAGVERVFSSMNYIKNKLRTKMGQKYLNDCLVTFIEREFFLQAKDKDIIDYFQNIKRRKVNL